MDALRSSLWYSVPLLLSALALAIGLIPFTHRFQQTYLSLPTLTIDASCDLASSLKAIAQRDGTIFLTLEGQGSAEPCTNFSLDLSVDDPDTRVEFLRTHLRRDYRDPMEEPADARDVNIGVDDIARSIAAFAITRSRLKPFSFTDPALRANCENPNDDRGARLDQLELRIADSDGRFCFFAPSRDFPLSTSDRRAIGGEISLSWFGAHGPDDADEEAEYRQRIASKIASIEAAPPVVVSADIAVHCPNCRSELTGDVLLNVAVRSVARTPRFKSDKAFGFNSIAMTEWRRAPASDQSVEEYLGQFQAISRAGFFGKEFFLIFSSIMIGVAVTLLIELMMGILHRASGPG